MRWSSLSLPQHSKQSLPSIKASYHRISITHHSSSSHHSSPAPTTTTNYDTKYVLLLNINNPVMSRPELIPSLTVDLAREILNKTLEELQKTENVQKLEEARDNVGNEMLKMMQYLFPIVMQVQMEVIKEYGFPEGRDGIVKFSQILRNFEREDHEIARLHGLIKAVYLPPVSVHTTESPIDERTNSS